MFKLLRHAELWLPSYASSRLRHSAESQPAHKIFVMLGDHFEPFWQTQDFALAARRMRMWRTQWPAVAERAVRDSAGRKPKHTFFFPAEEYRAEFLDQLAEMAQQGIGDVEVHIHHGGESRQSYIDALSAYLECLHDRHGLLHLVDGKRAFGFIHGNWALDNSHPDGLFCGIDHEIRLLKELGCYADFTMPSGNSPTQSRIVNQIYWVTENFPGKKSYDRGVRAMAGQGRQGELLMISGPLGLRWRERLRPRLETGEVAGYDLPSAYRTQRWFDLAPRLGDSLFLKLYTHGTQERNASPLLDGALLQLYQTIAAEARRRGMEYYFVSAWEMYCELLARIDAVSSRHSPSSS